MRQIDWLNYENEYIKVIKLADNEIQNQYNKNRKNKTQFWEVQCKNCGKIFVTSKNNIKRIKSCGCSRLKIFEHEDEIGKKYGKLTIIEFDEEKTKENNTKDIYYGPYFKCQCECGTIKSYRLSSIKNGHIKSCGCIRFNNPLIYDDLKNQRFGRLVVIERDIKRDLKEKNPTVSRVHWLCKCDCGNIVSVLAKCLKSGETKSCGCLSADRLIEYNKTVKPKLNKTYSYKINPIQEGEDIITVLNEEQNDSFIIDKEDYNIISKWYWRKDNPKKHSNAEGYWITNAKIDDIKEGKPMTLRVHQLIAIQKYGEYDKTKYMPDHLNRNHNDNRKCNIVLKTNIENSHNRGLSYNNNSGKTGVYKHKNGIDWCANITVNYSNIDLGIFPTFEMAVNARKEAEKLYGFTCDDVFPNYDVTNKEE